VCHFSLLTSKKEISLVAVTPTAVEVEAEKKLTPLLLEVDLLEVVVSIWSHLATLTI
jgi:hypothetical protein